MIEQFPKPPVREYPKEAELQMRLHSVIDEYAGEISFVSVVGVLALVQQEIIMRHTNLEEHE